MAAIAAFDEVDLMARARCDPEAFGAIYSRHHMRIYRFAYKRLGDSRAAEDVASEVFMKAFAAVPRFRDTGRPVLAWLYRIAANAIVDRCRRAERFEPLDARSVDSSTETPESSAIRAMEMRRIWLVIDGLPRDQRAALILRFGEDRSTKDIAARMERSNGATKVLIHRALDRVRESVGDRRTFEERPRVPGRRVGHDRRREVEEEHLVRARTK